MIIYRDDSLQLKFCIKKLTPTGASHVGGKTIKLAKLSNG